MHFRFAEWPGIGIDVVVERRGSDRRTQATETATHFWSLQRDRFKPRTTIVISTPGLPPRAGMTSKFTNRAHAVVNNRLQVS
jgi:hypothetical protein